MNEQRIWKILLLVILKYVYTAGNAIASYSCVPGEGKDIMVLQFWLLKNEDTVHSIAVYSSVGPNPVIASLKENCVVSGSGLTGDPFRVEVFFNYSRPITNSNGGNCGISEDMAGTRYRMRVKSVAKVKPDSKTDVFYEFICDKNNFQNLTTRLIPIPAYGKMPAYVKGIEHGVTLRVMDANTHLPVKEVETDMMVFVEIVFYPPSQSNEFHSKGREFWVGAMESGIISSAEIKLYLLSASNFYADIILYSYSGVLEESDTHLIVQPGSYLIKSLKLNPHQSGEQAFSKSVKIVSSEDIYVMVGHTEGNSDALFTVLPTKSLGTDYYLTPAYWYGNILIISTQNFTEVSFNTRGDINLPGGVLSDFGTRNFTLQEFESVHGSAEYGNFLHGTRITANKPVAVFVGGRTIVGIQTKQTDHSASQIMHKQKLGKRFIIPSGRGVVNCVAVRNSTELTHFEVAEILNEQDYFVKVRNSYSSQFFAIVANSSLHCNIEYGDKHDAMTMVPSISQWSSAYTFYVDREKTNYILKIAIRAGEENGIQMYGSGDDSTISLSSISWSNVLKATSTTPDYVGGSYNIDSKKSGPLIRLFHLSAKFMAILIHDDSDNGVVTAAAVPGFYLPSLNLENDCQSSLGYHGDLIDNDCDGDIDEDNITNIVDTKKDFEDLDGTIYDKLNIIGIRPYSLHVTPAMDKNSTLQPISIIDENGCLPDFTKDTFFRPSATFHRSGVSDHYPITYRTGTFKIAKINNFENIKFTCQVQFCLDQYSSCHQDICQMPNQIENTHLGTEIEATVLIKEKQTVQMDTKQETKDISTESVTADKSGIDITTFWVVVAVLGVLLLASLATVFCLCGRINHILSDKTLQANDGVENVKINGSTERPISQQREYTDMQQLNVRTNEELQFRNSEISSSGII